MNVRVNKTVPIVRDSDAADSDLTAWGDDCFCSVVIDQPPL